MMRTFSPSVLLVLAGSVLLAGSVAAGDAAAPAAKPAAPAPASPGFEKLKSLIGEWQGKATDGSPIRASYRAISNGTCIEETIRNSETTDMVSVYCPDGKAVLMTHYCAANNQPRMRAAAGGQDARTLAFDFVDVGNLTSPSAGHMRTLRITFVDPDHLTQEWTYRQDGKETPEVFQLERKG